MLWRRGANVLTAANIIVTRDDRFRLVDGTSLQINRLEPHDAGDYICQISDHVNKDLIHTVEIMGEYKWRPVGRVGDLRVGINQSRSMFSGPQHSHDSVQRPVDGEGGRQRLHGV